jgi:Na+-driven multidrug efflux pump
MQLSGTLFNTVVDPVLIFGLFGMPRMGAKGAALATVFGQLLGCVLGHLFDRHFNKEVALSIRKIRPHLQTMKDIYMIGIPSIVLQAVGALMNFSINNILSGFSDLAVTTFGVYFKLQSFVFMPIFGMNNGSVPIIAYNYGADRKDRLEQAMSLGVRYGVGVMAVGTLIFWLFPEQLMSLFSAPPEMVKMGVVALHIMSLNFPFAGYAIMRGAAFQALGKSVYSMNISLVRQLLIIIPCSYIYAKIGGVNMVWWAFPCAEVAGFTMSVLYTRRIRRTIINKMTPRDEYGNPLDENGDPVKA